MHFKMHFKMHMYICICTYAYAHMHITCLEIRSVALIKQITACFFILADPFAREQMFAACSQRIVSVGKTIDFPLVLQRFQVGRSMIVHALVMQCPRPKQVDPPACSWQYVQLAGENHVFPMVSKGFPITVRFPMSPKGNPPKQQRFAFTDLRKPLFFQ